MNEISRRFADYYNSLSERFDACGRKLSGFSEYEQETIVLYHFNSDYGANGLVEYVSWHGRSLLEPTLRGLSQIGAERLGSV